MKLYWKVNQKIECLVYACVKMKIVSWPCCSGTLQAAENFYIPGCHAVKVSLKVHLLYSMERLKVLLKILQ